MELIQTPRMPYLTRCGPFAWNRHSVPWLRSSSRQNGPAMPSEPNCSKCGRPMTLRRAYRAPHPADDEHMFHCPHCDLDYVVKGNMPTGHEGK